MRIFASNRLIPEVTVTTLEGQTLNKPSTLKELLVGSNALLVESCLPKGMVNPPHRHGHESLCYLVSGRVRLDVAGQTYLMEPGDAVLHPAGVVHASEVLEEATWLEVKAPPERTWNLDASAAETTGEASSR